MIVKTSCGTDGALHSTTLDPLGRAAAHAGWGGDQAEVEVPHGPRHLLEWGQQEQMDQMVTGAGAS